MWAFSMAAIVVLSTWKIFHSLPSQVGCSFQGKLFSIFKLLCLVFVTYYHSFHTSLKNCVLFVISLRSSWENFSGDTRFVLLTKAINLLYRRSIHFCKHSPSLHRWVSVIGLYCYHINCIHVLVLCSHFEQLWMQSNCWTYTYWSCLLTTWQY